MNSMKHSIKVFLFLSMFIQLHACKKKDTSEPPQGRIVFWLSKNNGCGPVTVIMDGKNVGQIATWQAMAPSNCNSSNLYLVVPTTQGMKNITFKNNCETRVVNVDLNSDCYIYNIH